MINTLYWHDYETTGAVPSRDRPTQFAGVRTDEDLNIIGDPLVLYCKPVRDILPQPVACLVTGITPQQAEREGVPEKEFIGRIHAELSKPGTCGVGYNSIRFDDEVTRYTLYRNFYDPYEREWKQNNSRWDIIDMMRLARALRPDGIIWPDYENGSPCFKLEELTAANGLSHDAAHDALSDVLATIALARLVREKQPQLYQYLYSNRSKQQVAGLVGLVQRKPFLHVSSKLPRENGYLGLMMPLAQHPVNKNAVLCINLMGDMKALVGLTSEQIAERVFTPADDLPSGVERLPLKAVHLNKCPVVTTPKLLDPAAAERLGIDIERCEQNWRYLEEQFQRKPVLASNVAAAFADREFESVTDPELQLYDGFLPNADKPLLAEVRNASAEELASGAIQFQDKRYQALLFLYRARNFPDSLSEQELAQWEELRFQRLTSPAEGYLTLDQYTTEIEQRINAADVSERDKSILLSLIEWGDAIL